MTTNQILTGVGLILVLAVGPQVLAHPPGGRPAAPAHVLLPALGLAAVLVVVARPLTAFASTLGTDP